MKHYPKNAQTQSSYLPNPTLAVNDRNWELGSKTLREIQYAGYLLGSDPTRISKHPVFNHIKFPPESYEFSQTSRYK